MWLAVVIRLARYLPYPGIYVSRTYPMVATRARGLGHGVPFFFFQMGEWEFEMEAGGLGLQQFLRFSVWA